MSTIAQELRGRLILPDPFTVKVRFTSTRKSAEFAITGVLDDGFIGQSIGRTQSGFTNGR